MTLEGDFLRDTNIVRIVTILVTNEWFPRHGYLDRATFDLTYKHPKKLHVASVVHVSEEPHQTIKLRQSQIQKGAAGRAYNFALGPFKRHTDSIKGGEGRSRQRHSNSIQCPVDLVANTRESLFRGTE